MTNKNKIDTSNELLFQRWDNGIKLIRPEKTHQQADTTYTVANILQLPHPLVIYFYNTDSVFLNVNEALAATNGFQSAQDAIGKTVFAVAKQESAEQLIANNLDVMKNNKIKIVEEELKRKDDIDLLALTIKTPWYNEENNIIGVFGCSFVLGAQSLAKSLLHSAKSIAEILGLSKRTVEQYLANIKEKLHVRSKGELIDMTIEYFI